MDWIERLLHVNLDNGNGSVELLIFLAVLFAAVGPVAAAVRRRRRR